MTVLDATRLILKHFEENDTFDAEKDSGKIVLITLSPDIDREIILFALKKLEDAEIVGKAHDKNLFFLIKPLQSYEKTLTLQYETIKEIVTIINSACDELDAPQDKINELSVGPKDVNSLCWIIREMQKGKQ